MMEYESLQTFFIVGMAVCGGIVTIDKMIGVVRGWLRPAAKTQLVHDFRRYLDNDNRRIESLEREMAERKTVDQALLEGQRQANRAIFAVLKHARTNNSTGLMDQVLDQLQGYLNEK